MLLGICIVPGMDYGSERGGRRGLGEKNTVRKSGGEGGGKVYPRPSLSVALLSSVQNGRF